MIRRACIAIAILGLAVAQAQQTPNLHLNVPSYGSNVNAWGPLLNNNFTTIDNWYPTVVGNNFTTLQTMSGPLRVTYLDATSGYKYNGAAPNGHCLVGNGTYYVDSSSCGGGGSMTWPATAGIAVYSGSSSWGTSLTAPTGAIVGTSDTQTLTNKTVDGVSPTTFGYLDPTSSVQTQLNGKQASLGFTPAHSGANSDITSLSGLSTPLSVLQGGTGTATPGLVQGTNITITGTWPNQTITASATAATAFSALTGSTNTSAAMVVGTGASLGVSGTGTIAATGIATNGTGNQVWGMNSGGSAQGWQTVSGSMTWPSGSAGIPNYSGSSSWGTTYNASNTIPANFVSTLNQNTTGTAANLSGTPALPNGTTATTQSANSADSKLATDNTVLNSFATPPTAGYGSTTPEPVAATTVTATTSVTTGNGSTTGSVQPHPGIFSTLAACSSTTEGTLAVVTDSTTVTWGATITGSGANVVLAFCDGSVWTVAAK